MLLIEEFLNFFKFYVFICSLHHKEKQFGIFVSTVTRINCQSNPASLYTLNKPYRICKLTDQNSETTT